MSGGAATSSLITHYSSLGRRHLSLYVVRHAGPVDGPVARVVGIDRREWVGSVPNRRESKDRRVADQDAAGGAARLVHREDLARGLGNDLCLKPAVLGATAGV